MSTKCKWNNGLQQFYRTPMFVAGGTISENEEFDSGTEGVVFTQTIPAGTFDSTNMHFKITLAGHISSDNSDDITFRLRMGTTDILETVKTTALPDEDDKCFMLEYFGRIHTTGASGKIVAQGRLMNEMTSMADVIKSTAVAGASMDLTSVTSINVTGQWDDTDATTDIFITTGFLELYTQ